MTPYRLIHTPSGEVRTLEADSARELHIGICECTFQTLEDDTLGGSVHPLFFQRADLVRQIERGEAVAVCGDWELREGRGENIHL